MIMHDDDRIKSMGNYSRELGWTEDIVHQAAVDTGFKVETRGATHGLSPDEHFSIWRTCRRNKTAFWDRVHELIQEAKVTTPATE